ncbi:SurA N-terminal domain-containing protein [Lagierella sp.]|uniref:SurA N-terminal domain-containing protein n=1 Tax=Lagierella sp. TaxID=2849657 RepID=UPI0026395018|nr:SurA N-terminal domain-containing protein [Lagierella sp.]
MKNITKKLFTGILASAMLLTGCGNAGKKPDNAIAKVGKEYISAEQVQEYYTYYKQQMEMFGQGGGFDESTEEGKKAVQGIRTEILNSLVMQEKTINLAKKEGIKVSEEEVNTSIDNLVEQAGGKEELDKFLKENNLTEEEFRKEQYDSFEKQNYITKLDEKLKKEHTPSEKDIEKRMEEDKDTLLPVYNANHILFSIMDENGQPITDEAKIEEVKKEAQATLDEVNGDKAKFDEAFEKYKAGDQQNGAGTFIKAEELGNFSGADMVPEFTKAVEGMKAGEVSKDLVQTQFGFHIIQSISKATDFKDLDENYYNDQLKAKYSEMITEDEISKYKEEQTNKIDVEFYDKDGKKVDSVEKAIESYDFSKIKGPKGAEESTDNATDATEAPKDNTENSQGQEETQASEETESTEK